jgi:hypothetical protein
VKGVSPINGVLGMPFTKLLAVTLAVPDKEPPGQVPVAAEIELAVNVIQVAWALAAHDAEMISTPQNIRDMRMVVSPVSQ